MTNMRYAVKLAWLLVSCLVSHHIFPQRWPAQRAPQKSLHIVSLHPGPMRWVTLSRHSRLNIFPTNKIQTPTFHLWHGRSFLIAIHRASIYHRKCEPHESEYSLPLPKNITARFSLMIDGSYKLIDDDICNKSLEVTHRAQTIDIAWGKVRMPPVVGCTKMCHHNICWS